MDYIRTEANGQLVFEQSTEFLHIPCCLYGFHNTETLAGKAASGRTVYCFQGNLDLPESERRCECGKRIVDGISMWGNLYRGGFLFSMKRKRLLLLLTSFIVICICAMALADSNKLTEDEASEKMFTLTEDEAAHIAAETIRQQTGVDVPLEDKTKYRYVAWKYTKGHPAWRVIFISETEEWGRCSAAVNDTTHEVIIQEADVYGTTADNILARYRTKFGDYSDWNSDIWADVAAAVRDLPATTMEGMVVKATPWIPWREGLLTCEQAKAQAFKQAKVRRGDLNCASLIDAQPNPIWKYRIIPWDESYQDSIVVEIDAVTGEMTDLDMYKSDHQDLEPYYHMITLHRIWTRLELEENGPLYLARIAVLKQFADLSFDMPEEDSLPIFKEDFWQPEIRDTTVRFRSNWSNLPDYQVTLDENGIPAEILILDSSGIKELSTDKMPSVYSE